MTTTRELLLKAAEDQEAHGHSCGAFFGETQDWPTNRNWWKNAPACAMGSLARVGGYVDDEEKGAAAAGYVRLYDIPSDVVKALAAHVTVPANAARFALSSEAKVMEWSDSLLANVEGAREAARVMRAAAEAVTEDV